MSGDLTAREVLARKLCEQWNEPQSKWRKYLPEADAVLAALAAAGWRLERDDHHRGFPVSSVAVARVARRIGEGGPRMIPSIWASNLLVEVLEGREVAPDA